MCLQTHTCPPSPRGYRPSRTVATKEHKRHAKDLVDGLEGRVHSGPPVQLDEITSAREFLHQHDFAPASDYFSRLNQIQDRVQTRSPQPRLPQAKRNYGGEAAGYWMQVQSAYDHVILSTCFAGEFNSQRGRVKISHRFNQTGRIDFVELKFLRSLEPSLNGAIRKLLLVRDYQHLRKDWIAAQAFILEVLPRELVFLFADIFRCDRNDLFAWLVNIGHRLSGDLVTALERRTANGHNSTPNPSEQLSLQTVQSDSVAFPILKGAAGLDTTVEICGSKTAVVEYRRTGLAPPGS